MSGSTPAADWKAQLAPAHTPPEPSAWPPSIWAVLLVLGLLLLLGLLLHAAWAWHRDRAWKRAALREWSQLQPSPDAQALSRLLRRVARHRAGAATAALGDADFAAYLHHSSQGRIPLPLAQELASAAHRPEPQLDQRALLAAKQWLQQC